MTRNRVRKTRGAFAWLAGFTVCVLAASPALPADPFANVPGFVDKSIFTRLADEQDVAIEVWLPGSLLKLVCAFDEELADLCDGLELIQAVVLDLSESGVPAKLRNAVAETERSLLKRGWVRLAKIKEEDGQVSVLVLNDEDNILGLTVLVVDTEEGELVFANIAGELDLSKIQRIGEEMDLPGLKDIEID